ncbi:MAG TPA: DUF4402 domain-containing protein [Flavisolibacter sp.]
MKSRIIALSAGILGFAATSHSQATVTATATATIVTPISITKNTDMNFGNVAVQAATGGTVVLAPAGTRTRTSGVTLPATAGTVTAAAFTVNGTGTYTYAITLPTSVTLTHSGGAGTGTMSADTFTSTPSGTGALTAGTQNIAVGATLNVAAAQAPGVYVSSPGFDVTVNYN